MTGWTVDRAAAVLLEAEDNRTDLSPITDEWPALDLATAYQVQDETLRRRLARGERLVGVKLGLTSRAKQQRMNISSPLTAWLTDAMGLPAVVADNASSAYYVTGPVAVPPASLDLGLEACLLERGGQVVDSATGAAVQGHPAEALALAANDLGRRGLAIEPGWVVLTGGMTDAIAVPAGVCLAAHFTHLGSVFLP